MPRKKRRGSNRLAPALLGIIVGVAIFYNVDFSPLFNAARAPESASATPALSPPQVVASPPLNAAQTRVPIALGVDSPASPLKPPDIAKLRGVMLEAINRDRAENGGLAPVQLDDLAGTAGQMHAEELTTAGYLSHWNQQGLVPDLRYALWGGKDLDMENVYSYFQRYSTGAPVPVDDFARYVREAEVSLMNSPGHRANILRPEHTHVGIGIAYNPKDGEFRVAQEFLNHYVDLDVLRETALPGETLVVAGRVLPGVSNPLINL
ncbi:MAG: CAP domain-containing protein, partial [Chloroflexi bacterium]|nr:CAP domain-containing protein [Chloroflexota bacterium]